MSAPLVLASGSNIAGPFGLAVILLLCIVCYFLFKSMSKHLRNVRDNAANFPGQDTPSGPQRPERPGRPGRLAGPQRPQRPTAPNPRAISPLPVDRAARMPDPAAGEGELPPTAGPTA